MQYFIGHTKRKEYGKSGWTATRRKHPGRCAENLLRQANFTIRDSTDPGQIESYSEIPIEFDVVLRLLSIWGIPATSYIIALEQLSETPMPHLTFICDETNGRKSQCPVLLMTMKNGFVHYTHPRRGLVTEQIADFSQKWNNVVIDVAFFRRNEILFKA